MRQSGRTTRAIKHLLMGHPSAPDMFYVMTGTHVIDEYLSREGPLHEYLRKCQRVNRYGYILRDGRVLRFAAFHSNNTGLRGKVSLDHAVTEPLEYLYGHAHVIAMRQIGSWELVSGGEELA